MDGDAGKLDDIGPLPHLRRRCLSVCFWHQPEGSAASPSTRPRQGRHGHGIGSGCNRSFDIGVTLIWEVSKNVGAVRTMWMSAARRPL